MKDPLGLGSEEDWERGCFECPQAIPRTVYLLTLNAILLAVIGATTRWWVIGACVAIMAADYTFHTYPQYGFSLNFYAHAVLGLASIKIGGLALLTEDGLLQIQLGSCIVSGTYLVLTMLLTIRQMGPGKLHETVHQYLYFILLLLTISMTSSSLFSQKSMNVVKAVRSLFDPVATFALGCLMYSHRHDGKPVALAWHELMGIYMMLNAVIQFKSIQVHSAHGAGASVSHMFRMLHCVAWCLGGTTLLHMAAYIYVFDHGGVRNFMYPNQDEQPDGWQEAIYYLVVDLTLSIGWTVGLVLRQYAEGTYDRVGDAGESPCVAVADAKL